MQASQPDRWILSRMTDELLARLDGIRRNFTNALVIGGDFAVIVPDLRARGLSITVADPGFAPAHAARGIQCDEDRLPFADRSFDLVLAIGTLDTVNDLPGALVLIRRILRPGGLFLGAMAGAGCLPALRRALAADGGIARFHPQIDVRAAGDLLGRAGFTLPVADVDILEVRYASFDRLTSDLRANGLRNTLRQRRAIGRTRFATASNAFRDQAQNGKTSEQFGIVYLTGWAPDAKPAAPAGR